MIERSIIILKTNRIRVLKQNNTNFNFKKYLFEAGRVQELNPYGYWYIVMYLRIWQVTDLTHEKVTIQVCHILNIIYKFRISERIFL